MQENVFKMMHNFLQICYDKLYELNLYWLSAELSNLLNNGIV